MRGRRASTEVLWPGAEGAPRGCAHPCAVGGLPQGGCLSALTEEEPETQAFCSLAKVTQGLVRTEVGSRIPAQPGGLWVLTAPAGKQVWSWGSSQSSQIPTGSLVICPPPPHPSARQVAEHCPAHRSTSPSVTRTQSTSHTEGWGDPLTTWSPEGLWTQLGQECHGPEASTSVSQILHL
ncbi:uncharacterized protein LOC117285889 isoform X3 [Fukomys damarensis]|uniref:uncharacterized protein LOC117285889 isoform X3 n=1 Tax=Fukomys damarensis TaxID=885580 RepID=UPI0014551C3A|nr:uncharacterized protein LOC117285889 isoform X3 [Fukomys damarensis]